MDLLVMFLFGVVCGAFGFASRIVDRCERHAWLQAYDTANALWREHQANVDKIYKRYGVKKCSLIKFGRHGNLQRWHPIDDPVPKPKPRKEKRFEKRIRQIQETPIVWK